MSESVNILALTYELARRQGVEWEPDPDRPGKERFPLADIVMPGQIIFRDNVLVRDASPDAP